MDAQALCSSFNGRNTMECIEIITEIKTLRLIFQIITLLIHTGYLSLINNSGTGESKEGMD